MGVNESDWGLEVVRGAEAGRIFPLHAGDLVLGNQLGSEPGIDLSSLEGNSPRRMAARQAQLQVSPAGHVLRDLDSPGGTFVNRQRILPGTTRTLHEGDVIQLGGVQLRLIARAPRKPPAQSAAAAAAQPAPPAARPAPAVSTNHAPRPAAVSAATSTAAPRHGPLASPYRLTNGVICRGWDDFLTVSAQHWSTLREELTSGRLDEFLPSVGRPDLAPGAMSPSRTADEQLDAWLGRLPVTRPLNPELDVHPAVIKVRAQPGGGTTRHKIAVTNVGYRLLKTRVRVEPDDTRWISLPRSYASGPFTTIDTTEIAFEVQAPEDLSEPIAARLHFEGNGGAREVVVTVEPAASDAAFVEPSAPLAASSQAALGDIVARVPAAARILAGGVLGMSARGLIAVGESLPLVNSAPSSSRPGLAGGAVVMGLFGGAIAAMLKLRRGPEGLGPAVFTGAYSGALLAALSVAVFRSVEPHFGRLGESSVLLACLFWGAVGVLTAIGSLRILPVRLIDRGEP